MHASPEEPTAHSVRVDGATRALGRIATFCQVPRPAAEIEERLRHDAPSAAADVPTRVAWLARAARDLGMRAGPLEAAPAEVLEIVRAGHPLLAPDPDRDAWTYVEADRRGRLHVTTILGSDGGDESRILRDAELEAALTGPDGVRRTWLLADPARPQAAAVSHDHAESLTGFQRVRRLLAPEKGEIAAIAVFAVTIGLLSLATPIAVQAIVNTIALSGLLQPLVVVSLLLAAALVFLASVTAIQVWVVELIQRRLFVRMVADVAARLPRVRAEAHAEGYGPELVNRFFDVVTVQKALSKLLIEALATILSIGAGLTILAFYHPLLLAFDVVLIVAIAAIVFGPLRRGQGTALAESTAKYEVVGWLEEIARSPRTFRIPGADQWVLRRSDELSRGWLTARRTHFRTLFGQMTGALILQALASTVLLWIGGTLVIAGSLTLGQLVAAELIVTAVVASVAKMGRHLEHWYDLTSAAHKVGKLLDVPLAPDGGEVPPRSVERGVAIELTGVTTHGGRDATRLGPLDASVAPGETIAFVGPSAQRAALLEVLALEARPASGVLRIDGRNTVELARRRVREDVAVVGVPEIVRGSIRENVRLYRPGVSDDDVRRALRQVGLDGVVAALPNGLETEIHGSSTLFSLEESGRLTLARALAGKPRALVVNGLFDALPPNEREHLLDGALLDENDGRTTILLTSNPKLATRIDRTVELMVPTGGNA